MSIQRTAWPLVLDANDFQRTDRGMKWGIKFHEVVGFGQSVHIVYVATDGSQKSEAIDDAFDIHILSDHGGDVLRWIKERVLPRLNAWLAKTFPPKAADDSWVPSIDATKLEEAWAAVAKIKITQGADGTLTASM